MPPRRVEGGLVINARREQTLERLLAVVAKESERLKAQPDVVLQAQGHSLDDGIVVVRGLLDEYYRTVKKKWR